jgi:hypothetical protein
MKMYQFLLICCLFPLTLYADSVDDVNISDKAWEAYLRGDFAYVEKLVMSAIADNQITAEQLAKLYLTLGCADAMRGRSATATTSFEMALINDPTLDPSSLDLPPPVWNLFKPVRDRMPRYLDSEREILVTDSIEVIKPVYRKRADVLRTFAVPGWGHLSEGRKKGLFYVGMETIAVTGLVISAVNLTRAGEDYHSARDAVIIADRYDTYNIYYQLTWGFIFLTAANYLAAQIDFFSTPPPITMTYDVNQIKYSVSYSFKL